MWCGLLQAANLFHCTFKSNLTMFVIHRNNLSMFNRVDHIHLHALRIRLCWWVVSQVCLLHLVSALFTVTECWNFSEWNEKLWMNESIHTQKEKRLIWFPTTVEVDLTSQQTCVPTANLFWLSQFGLLLFTIKNSCYYRLMFLLSWWSCKFFFKQSKILKNDVNIKKWRSTNPVLTDFLL